MTATQTDEGKTPQPATVIAIKINICKINAAVMATQQATKIVIQTTIPLVQATMEKMHNNHPLVAPMLPQPHMVHKVASINHNATAQHLQRAVRLTVAQTPIIPQKGGDRKAHV